MEFSRNLRRSGVSEHALTKLQAVEDLPYLTDEQETSFQLLLEWQKARNSSVDMEKDAKVAESRVSSSTTEKIFRYQDVLAKLKSSEFEGRLKRIGRKKPAEKNLRTLRQKAAYYAACERIASSFWTGSPPKADALLTRREPLYGASLVPGIQIDYGLPYYIWDSQRNEVRTSADVVLETPTAALEYVAVSHSWVRWEDDSVPSIQLPGVPWAIPQNTKFDVKELPQKLAALPWRYFFIDLLTIPQGTSLTLDEGMMKRQDWEIKRVPQIFGKAFKGLIWIDDIPSWTVLPAALQYLSLQYLSFSDRSGLQKDLLQSELDSANTTANNPLELLDHPKNRQSPATTVWEPNAWFSSSWSLQEAIMRPDMLLCNKNLDILEISPGIPVALNDIAALLKVFQESGKATGTLPLSIQELYQLFERVGLMHLLDLTLDTSLSSQLSINGVKPIRDADKGYPLIVPTSTLTNPHTIPTREGARISHRYYDDTDI